MFVDPSGEAVIHVVVVVIIVGILLIIIAPPACRLVKQADLVLKRVPCNEDPTGKWKEALDLLRKCGFKEEANRMIGLDQAGKIFCDSEDASDDAATIARRVTGINTHCQWTPSDVAMQILGEHHRQVDEDKGTTPAQMEAKLQKLLKCLQGMGKPPAGDWHHPEQF